MKIITRLFLTPLLVSLLSGCAARNPAPDAPHAPHARALLAHPRIQTLLEKAQTAGRVRVIAGVRVSYLQQDEFGVPASQAHRDELDQARGRLIEAMQAKGVTSAKPLHNLPHILFDVSAEQLKHLIRTGQVISLEENLVFRPPSSATGAPPAGRPLASAATPPADWNANYINAPAAWELGLTGKGQTIAIIDSGIDSSHISLNTPGKIRSEACFSTNVTGLAQSTCPNGEDSQIGPGSAQNCSTSVTGCGHGTAVAGIAAGKRLTYSPQVVTGIAPDADLISIQIGTLYLTKDLCDLVGAPKPCLTYELHNVIEAIGRVIELSSSQSIAAINMSLGGNIFPGYCDRMSPLLFAAVNAARDLGIASFAAAGNDSTKSGIRFPACMSNVIGVGSVGLNGALYSKSNWSTILSLLAPGEQITAPSITSPKYYWTYHTGTSYASPQAAAAWALLKSTQRYQLPISLNVAEYLSYFQRMGLPVPGPGGGSQNDKSMVFVQMWSDPLKVASPIGGEPDCVSWGPDRIDCFAKGYSNNQLYQITWDGKVWSDWNTWDGQLNQRPSCFATKGVVGSIDCFFWGFDAKLWHVAMRDSAWRTPTPVPNTNITSVPDCISPTSGTTDCFARWGKVGSIPSGAMANISITEADTVTVITSLGGNLGSPPDCLSRKDNYRECWARDHEGALMHTFNNDASAWTPWTLLESGTKINGTPSCVSWGPNRLDCFARNTDNQMIHIRWAGGTWGTWETHQGKLAEGPYCASRASGRIDCFASAEPGGALVHKAWNGSAWAPNLDQPWAPLGEVAVSRVNCVAPAPAQFSCFYQGADNALRQASWGIWHKPQ